MSDMPKVRYEKTEVGGEPVEISENATFHEADIRADGTVVVAIVEPREDEADDRGVA